MSKKIFLLSSVVLFFLACACEPKRPAPTNCGIHFDISNCTVKGNSTVTGDLPAYNGTHTTQVKTPDPALKKDRKKTQKLLKNVVGSGVNASPWIKILDFIF